MFNTNMNPMMMNVNNMGMGNMMNNMGMGNMMNNMGMGNMMNNMGMNNMQNMMNNMGMGMGMNNMQNMMNNMGMGNMMNSMLVNAGNEDWMKGFEMAMNENNQPQPREEPGPKMNIVFNTTQGTITAMIFKYGTTIGQALEMYLKRVGRPDLINNLQGRLCFLVNARQLKFTDNTKVEDFFKNSMAPKVIVNDVNNLIGA